MMSSSNFTADYLVQAVADAPAEQIVEGFRIKWLFDKRILYVIAEGHSRTAVDQWALFMIPVILNWPNDRTYLAVQDLSSPKFAFTSYMRERVAAMYHVRPSLSGRVAIVLPRTIIGQLVELFIRGDRNNHFATRYFYEPGKALLWLSEQLSVQTPAATPPIQSVAPKK